MSKPPISWQFKVEQDPVVKDIVKLLDKLKGLQKIIVSKDGVFREFQDQLDALHSGCQSSLAKLQSRKNNLVNEKGFSAKESDSQTLSVINKIGSWQKFIEKIESLQNLREKILEMRSDLNLLLVALNSAIQGNKPEDVKKLKAEFQVKREQIEKQIGILIQNTPKSATEADKVLKDLKGRWDALQKPKPPKVKSDKSPTFDPNQTVLGERGRVFGRKPWE